MQMKKLNNQLNAMNITCGTDFSIHAAHAANVAAALAVRGKSTLRLLHGVEPASVEFLPKPAVDQLRERLRRKLVAEGNRLRASGAHVSESLAFGRPHEVLANDAEPAKSNLIVVSSIGHVAPSRWLVGSVAEKTAQLAKVPTLVVRDHESLLAWLKGRRKLKVLVGYDFSASSDAALHWAASLKRFGVCRTVVAYVSWPPKESWRFGAGGPDLLTENGPGVRSLLERDLKERCAQVFGIGMPQLRVVANWGQAEEKLIELAHAEAADLIVLGTNQRRGLNRFWLGSVSREILHRATTNVVCVPAVETLNPVADRIPSYRRVLVPTDFSQLANRAVAYAYGAAARGGEVCLVHVIPPTNVSARETNRRDGPHAKRKRELTDRLQALVPDEALGRGIRSRVEIAEHQHPDAAICQAAERFGADLICIGSRGRSGLKKKLLGSVTEGVMRRSTRPVLVIRE